MRAPKKKMELLPFNNDDDNVYYYKDVDVTNMGIRATKGEPYQIEIELGEARKHVSIWSILKNHKKAIIYGLIGYSILQCGYTLFTIFG